MWFTIAGVLVATSLPYLYGYLSSPPDKRFMGLMLDIPDHGQYLSWWRSFQNSILVSNKLTSEPNAPLFFNLQWWILAQVSRWTGLGYAPVYQAFRWVAGALFLWASYRLIAWFLPAMRQRRLAFLLIAFSSGLGWVLILLKYTVTHGTLLFPLDVYIAEGNSFLCILGYPHFALAAALIVLILEYVWRGWWEERTWCFVAAGVLALLLGWMHAYDLILVYGITGSFALLLWWKRRRFPWRLFKGGLILLGLSCSGAIYSAALTTMDPLWEEVLAQFANAGVYTPGPLHLAVLFGVPFPLAIWAWIRSAWKRQWSEENLFTMGWFLTGAVLNYIPTDFQIHMLNSWQVPMMILAARGAHDLTEMLAANWEPDLRIKAIRWASAALIVLVLPTNLYLLAWRFVDLARQDYPYYLYRDEIAAAEWLRQNTLPSATVLSTLTVGQYLPALSGNSVVLAHWAQTIRFYDKQEQVTVFYDATASDEERARIVQAYGIDYVFHGPAERAVGDYDPRDTRWLEVVYSAPRVSVYAVRHALLGISGHELS